MTNTDQRERYQPLSRTHGKLVLFALISLLIHGGAGLFLTPDDIRLSVGHPQGDSTIVSVRIETQQLPPISKSDSAQSTPQPVQRVIPEKSVPQPGTLKVISQEPSPTTQPQEIAQAPTETVDSPPVNNVTTSMPATSELKSSSHEMLASSIKDAIHLQMADRFSYPPLARRRGWEGTVQVKLLITPETGITRSEIKHSSGYFILDQAVLDSLDDIRSEDLPLMAQLTQPLDMVLSVQYQLSDS